MSLPQHTPAKCQIKRYLDLQKEQKTYKLTKPRVSTTLSTEGIAMPTQDIKDILSCPLLNLTIKQVVGLALMDPNQQLWFKLFQYISIRNENFTKLYEADFTIYENISDYIDIYEKALAFQVVSVISRNTLAHFSKNLVVYYCTKCCNLIGCATRYLFVNRYRVAASITRQGRVFSKKQCLFLVF